MLLALSEYSIYIKMQNDRTWANFKYICMMACPPVLSAILKMFFSYSISTCQPCPIFCYVSKAASHECTKCPTFHNSFFPFEHVTSSGYLKSTSSCWIFQAEHTIFILQRSIEQCISMFWDSPLEVCFWELQNSCKSYTDLLICDGNP